MDSPRNSNLDAAGRLPVIVRARSGADLFKAREAVTRLEGAAVGDTLPIIDGFLATVPPQEYRELMRSRPTGVEVYVDEKRRWIDPQPSPRRPLGLDNAAPTLGVNELWQRGHRGQGVTIAVVDTGIHPHPDLKDRIVAFRDVVNGRPKPYDDQGHGTHVAGDAAGNGAESAGRFVGTAPEASLVGVKVLDAGGSGRLSNIIKGIEWTVANRARYNIRVINMSLGGPARGSYKNDPICQAVERAVDAGMVAVVAAGNSGPGAKTVGTPGNDPRVITVGALDDRGTLAREDDDIAKFSSRGPTPVDALTKPDVLAPGVAITAPTSPGSPLDTNPKVPHEGPWYITISGTSMATPVVAGVVADLLGAVPEASPQQVKDALMATARPLVRTPPYDGNQQGSGVVDPLAALSRLQGAPARLQE